MGGSPGGNLIVGMGVTGDPRTAAVVDRHSRPLLISGLFEEFFRVNRKSFFGIDPSLSIQTKPRYGIDEIVRENRITYRPCLLPNLVVFSKNCANQRMSLGAVNDGSAESAIIHITDDEVVPLTL